jgi:hypothetical protein
MNSSVLVKGIDEDFFLEVNPAINSNAIFFEPGEPATDVVASNHSSHTAMGIEVEITCANGSARTESFVVGAQSFKAYELPQGATVSKVTAMSFSPKPKSTNTRY